MSSYTSFARESLGLYLRTTLESRRDAWWALLNPIGSMLTLVGVPFFASQALGSIAANNGQFQRNLIIVILVAFLGVLMNRIGFVKLMILQAKTMSRLHTMTFERLMDRSVGFHNNQISGKLVSDAIDFVVAYSTMLMAAYNNGFSFAVILLSGLILVSLSSWQLGLFLLLAVSVTLIWAYRESKTRGHLRLIRLQASKKLTGHLSDNIVNAQTVKTFAAESREIAKNRELNEKLLSLRIRDWWRAGISGNDRMAALLVMLVLLLVLINYLAQRNPNVIATGFFAFTYTFTLLIRLFDLNMLTRQIEESLLQASPMTQILMETSEIVDAQNAAELQVTRGSVKFQNVHFQYADNENKQGVFSRLNLDVSPGEKIGLVGPSGGGKTTLTRLLLRFEDVQSGEVVIDGQNIASVTQQSLRSGIAYVPQEPLLFHRSIKENIAYGKQGASMNEILAAARLAHADEFIIALTHEYDTIVGERGVKLSGGQRQRVAIARAMLRNAPILVLDEATSALDSESEKLIQVALWELMKDKTAIVIAHRLSTIQRMDRIIVLDEGKIIEQGTHKELLENKGLYARLWSHQSGGFLEE